MILLKVEEIIALLYQGMPSFDYLYYHSQQNMLVKWQNK